MRPSLQPKEVVAPIEAALNEWAVYARDGIKHLALPSRTLLGKLIDEGPSGAAQGGKLPVEAWSDVAERVEQAVLHRLTKQEQAVICSEVFFPWPREVKARRCGVSATRWSHLLASAKRSIADYLHI
jgi:hypothetical protein